MGNILDTDILHTFSSTRHLAEEAVIIPEENPFFGFIGASIACWYDNMNSSGLKPLLVQKENQLTFQENVFLKKFSKNSSISLLVLGEHINTSYETTEILGSASSVSLNVAEYVFCYASTALIIPNSTRGYQLGLLAVPIASYLSIPLIVYNNNTADLNETCATLNISSIIVIGDNFLELANISSEYLETEEEIQSFILAVIKEKFGEINYLTITNPADVQRTPANNISKNEFFDTIKNNHKQ